MNQHVEQAKAVGDIVALTGTVAVVVGYLPAVAAFVTIIWTLIRIYETETAQRLLDWLVGLVRKVRG